jgi:threonine dehydratase
VVRLDLDRIRAAVPLIAPVFRGTPKYECEQLGAVLGCRITVKVETFNPIRCFKGRGTETVLARLVSGGGPYAVVCASAGNLGQALAYSSRRHGVPCTVVASVAANPLKLRRMRELGATVQLVPGDIEDARRTARELAGGEARFLVEDSENLDTGVGHVVKSLAPSTAVVGVQSRGAPAMALSWRAGHVVHTETIETIADGVAGRHPIPQVLDDLLAVADDVLLVEEESIMAGMRLLFEHAGLVVEPAAALGLAAVLENRSRYAGAHVATVVCGANVAPSDFRRWVLD